MARIRSIKPQFFLNDDLAQLPPLDRLLFIGLWTQADREGRLEDKILKIKATILPYEEYDVNAALDRLAQKKVIIRYSIKKANYLQIINFSKHQYPHKNEPKSIIPAPYKTKSKPIQVPDESGLIIVNGNTVNSNMVNGSEEEPQPPKVRSIKTSIPKDFKVSDQVKKWALEKGYNKLEEHLEAFKRKVAANGYKYVSWDDAFMEAIRGDWAKLNFKKKVEEKSLADKYPAL